jgi:uncharacterized protein (TIGR01777 family)
MRTIIAGATGFIGQHLTKRWIKQGIDVVAVGRSPEKIKAIFGDKVEVLSWQDFDNNSASLLDHVNVVVNLSGAGVADKLWTDKHKKEILKSRTETTKVISAFCARSQRKDLVLLNAGAIGIYGLHKDATPFDEHSIIHYRQTSFLSTVCRQWEHATQQANDNGVRVIHMRFGHVLDMQGGLLARMITPFKWGLGPVFGSGQQIMSWISLEDLCSVIEFLVEHQEINGLVNCVSPKAVTNREFAQVLAKALKKPCFLKVPGWLLKMALGAMADELFLNGQCVKPAVLLERGFQFKDADIRSFLERTLA